MVEGGTPGSPEQEEPEAQGLRHSLIHLRFIRESSGAEHTDSEGEERELLEQYRTVSVPLPDVDDTVVLSNVDVLGDPEEDHEFNYEQQGVYRIVEREFEYTKVFFEEQDEDPESPITDINLIVEPLDNVE